MSLNRFNAVWIFKILKKLGIKEIGLENKKEDLISILEIRKIINYLISINSKETKIRMGKLEI